MKRIIAIILVIMMLLTMMLSLVGCGATSADSALSMGQWVTLIADSFGMQNYVTEEPYFEKVKSDNSYFAFFQMAAEWDILTPSDEINESTPVKWEDAWITLVNAGGFLSDDASDDEKIDFAVSNFGDGMRKYWSNRYIKLAQAIVLLDTAQRMWCEKPIENPVQEAKFTNDVKNYLETDVQYIMEDGIIKMPVAQIEGLGNGDVFALPCSGENAAMIKKVTNITYDGDYAYIEYEEVSDEELENYAESVVVRDSTEIDFSNIIGIYDEAGNPIVFDDESSNIDNVSNYAGAYKESTLAYSNFNKPGVVSLGDLTASDVKVVNTGIFDNAKGEYTFKIKDNKITLSLSGQEFGIKWSKDSNKKTINTEIPRPLQQ